MRLCLPTATFFPYTTLFRSAGSPDVWCFMGDSITSVAFDPAKPDVFPTEVGKRHAGYAPIVVPGATGGDETRVTLDRKSTRLNSSHVRISYAVFCLKKKNKK